MSDGSVMGEDLTLPELARRVRESAERLREWRSLGLIGREGLEAFDPETSSVFDSSSYCCVGGSLWP